ncbi:MAG: DUF45 domain-containing protein [Corynebacterium sp.]|nr:DUF45 domain-containing protein [Corynebacterium sp.]
MPNTFDIEVIRSARRTRTASGRLVNGRIQVRVPANMLPDEEAKLVDDIVTKIKRKTSATARSDDELTQRAHHLNETILNNNATIGSIRWVTNQNQRWGSCSPATGDIRISHRLQNVPDYVLDAVIIHELTHTFILDGHSPEFWSWADKAPKAERAKGFLEAWGRMGQQGN